MWPSCPRSTAPGLVQYHEVLMRHGSIEAERSYREPPAERGDGPCADCTLGEPDLFGQCGQDAMRCDALPADDVVGDDVDRMSTGSQHVPIVAEDRLQVCIEGAEPSGNGFLFADGRRDQSAHGESLLEPLFG